jgi:methenyltetrahydromethanopterin cyclohydrolase
MLFSQAMGKIAQPAAQNIPHEATTLFDSGRAAVDVERTHLLDRSVNMDAQEESADSVLLDLASRMDADGGMPGKDLESRAGVAAVALLAFLSQGHTLTRGAFRSHVVRLVSFLTSMNGLATQRQGTIAAVVEWARKGSAPAGDWIALARTPGEHWSEIDKGTAARRPLRPPQATSLPHEGVKEKTVPAFALPPPEWVVP